MNISLDWCSVYFTDTNTRVALQGKLQLKASPLWLSYVKGKQTDSFQHLSHLYGRMSGYPHCVQIQLHVYYLIIVYYTLRSGKIQKCNRDVTKSMSTVPLRRCLSVIELSSSSTVWNKCPKLHWHCHWNSIGQNSNWQKVAAVHVSSPSPACLLSPLIDVAWLWFRCLLMSVIWAAVCLSLWEYSLRQHEYSTLSSILGALGLLIGRSLGFLFLVWQLHNSLTWALCCSVPPFYQSGAVYWRLVMKCAAGMWKCCPVTIGDRFCSL